MSFDALETRVSAAAMKRLSNARAYVALGDFPVIFDAAPVSAIGGGIDTTRPQFEALDSDVAAFEVEDGTSLVIRDVDYTARNPQADGTGITLFFLETV